MKDNIIKEKSLAFGVRITKMSKYFINNLPFAEHAIFSQILRSGTSIGANIREAEFGESKTDFMHKLKIALKEANETEYWLEIIFKSEYISESQYNSLIIDCKELIKLLTAIINSLNNNSTCKD